MSLERVVNRAAEVAGVYGHLRTTPGRVDDLALATLSAKAADHQLELFARWCYQQHDGHYIHILPNGQLPAGQFTPWSESGRSNMSKPDRRILRAWIVGLAHLRHFPPWLYYEAQRRWYVDLNRYDSEADCLGWLKKHPISPPAWLSLALSLRG